MPINTRFFMLGITLTAFFLHLSLREPTSWIWEQIRLPRCLLSFAGGCILGGVGSFYQAIFRNPLADPYSLGVSSSAGLGGTLVILLGLGSYYSGLYILLGALSAGIISIVFLNKMISYRLFQETRWILGGLFLSQFLNAINMLLLIYKQVEMNTILRWLIGSSSPTFWPQVILLWMAFLLSIPFFINTARQINIFYLLGEEAVSLGISWKKLFQRTFIVTTLLTSLVIGTMGIIGFVGLVTPHLSKKIVGIDLRRHFWVSIWMGGTLLVFADWLCMLISPTGEVPLGLMTTILAMPFLLKIIKEEKRWWTV